MRLLFLLFALAASGWVSAASARETLRLHPKNPRYFEWRGQPLFLLTSAEHYGAVLNADFDYHLYLDTLTREGMNHTRLFTGGMYVEPPGAFNIDRNTLAPGPGRFLSPYARSDQPGYAGGGNKFDLDRWDDAYFARLRDFMSHAARRGIIVEVNLFCVLYEDPQWQLSPYHPRNHVNGLPEIQREHVLTLDHSGPYLALQEQLARKFVQELRDFGNLYFEIINEPYVTATPDDWQRHLTEVVADAQRRHAHPKLISWNIANNTAVVSQPHPAVSIFNFHYASPPEAVAQNWGLNRVIGDNETGFRGTNNAFYRMEGWDFLLAGGGLFNNLDYSFATGFENGTFPYPATQPGGGNPQLRREFRTLGEFLRSFPFVRMRPEPGLYLKGVPSTHTARALVEPGRSVAAYFRPYLVTRFSTRWTGFLEAPATGEYTFYTLSNDGVRLWLKDQNLIDHWNDHGATEDTARIHLEAGRRYPIRLEYFYNGGQSVMQLAWSGPGVGRQIIPARALHPPTGTGSGLRGEYFEGIDLQQPWRERTDSQVDFTWGTASPFGPPAGQNSGTLELALPTGTWQADWLDPVSGRWVARQTVTARQGRLSLHLPEFTEDLALRLKRR